MRISASFKSSPGDSNVPPGFRTTAIEDVKPQGICNLLGLQQISHTEILRGSAVK